MNRYELRNPTGHNIVLPQHFNPGASVRLSMLISDIDRTAISTGISRIQGSNRVQLVRSLLMGKDVHLISGSPYHPQYAGLDFSRESIQRRVAEPVFNSLQRLRSIEMMPHLKIHYISGKGKVTFTGSGTEQMTEDKENLIPDDINFKIAVALAGGFCARVKGICLNGFMRGDLKRSLDSSVDLKAIEAVVRKATGIEAVRFWPFGSELALIFHSPKAPNGDGVDKFARSVLEAEGIILPEDNYSFSGGGAYAKVARIKKRDVIEKELAALNPNGAVLGLGDSNADDFLLLDPDSFLFFPVYLGAEKDMEQHPQILTALDRFGKDRMEARGFGRTVKTFLDAEEAGKTYYDLPIFLKGQSINQLIQMGFRLQN